MEIEKNLGKMALDLLKNEQLVKSTSDVFGMLFPYCGLRKKALDVYIEEVEKSNMPSESKIIAILNAKETLKRLKNQSKIVEIAVENAKQDTDFSNKSGVNGDWLDRFMDAAKFVTDEQMQLIWGKVLSKEFEKPGATPSSLIRILSEITWESAVAFKKICSMNLIMALIGDDGKVKSARTDIIVPYDDNSITLAKMGLSFDVINELDTIGLIKFKSILGFNTDKIVEETIATYVNGKTEVIVEHKENTIPKGNIMLTKAGECLRNITSCEEICGYDNMIKAYFTKHGIKYMEKPIYEIIKDGDGIVVQTC